MGLSELTSSIQAKILKICGRSDRPYMRLTEEKESIYSGPAGLTSYERLVQALRSPMSEAKARANADMIREVRAKLREINTKLDRLSNVTANSAGGGAPEDDNGSSSHEALVSELMSGHMSGEEARANAEMIKDNMSKLDELNEKLDNLLSGSAKLAEMYRREDETHRQLEEEYAQQQAAYVNETQTDSALGSCGKSSAGVNTGNSALASNAHSSAFGGRSTNH